MNQDYLQTLLDDALRRRLAALVERLREAGIDSAEDLKVCATTGDEAAL